MSRFRRFERALGKALAAALLLGPFSTAALASDDALFQAIEDGRQLAAVALVTRGEADVNARNAQRETPLHRAVEKDMRGLAQALVRAGASLYARTSNGETALHFAALHADPYFVDLLLAAGADPRARNDDGESVLFWALLSGNTVVAQRLIEHGADPDARDLEGNTARQLLERRGK